MLKTGFLNLLLRGTTLISKFVLLIYLARTLPPEELGIFGIMSVTLAIGVFILGLDFHVFNTREMLAGSERSFITLFRDQLVFHGLVYLVVLPLFVLVFWSGTIPWKYVLWFYPLLIVEHLAQESIRLLITLSRPVSANLILFMRSGLWVYAVLAVTFWSESTLQLSVIWMAWAIGGGMSLALTLFILYRVDWRESCKVPIDWSWIRAGVKICLPFFAATLALMGVLFADRYFLQHFHGEEVVGIYTFFAGISNVVHVFVFSGVTMILYPGIVAARQRSDIGEYRRGMRRLSVGVVTSALATAGIAAIAIKPLLLLVGNEVYTAELSAFWIMLASATVFAISNIPHYALYAQHRDRALVIATIFALVVGVVMNALLVPGSGIIGAAFATLAAMLTLAMCKTVFVLLPVRYLSKSSSAVEHTIKLVESRYEQAR